MNKLQQAVAMKLYEVISEQVAKPADVDAGPHKVRAPRNDWDTANPMGSYGTVDPNGKVQGVLDHSKGGEGQPDSISSYINTLQNSDGSKEQSQNLFQR